MLQEGIQPAANASQPQNDVGTNLETQPRASISVRLLAILAVLAVVYIARDVLIPVVFAALLAILLRPLFRLLQRTRLPDLVSSLVLVSGVAGVFVFGMLTLAGQAQAWLSQAPDTVRSVSNMVPTRWGPFDDLEKTKAAVKDLASSSEAQPPLPVEVQSNEFNYTMLGASGHFLAGAVIVFVLCFFLLGLSDSLLKQAVESRMRFGEKRNIVQLVQNLEQGVSRYLLTISVINIGLGIVTSLVLWILRVPNPMLWGVLAATLNYIPHVGAFVCMGVLFFVGAVTHESIGYGLFVAAMFAIITALESYLVTPLVLSKSLQLSPLATILAILFCGWMWGIPGGLMAAPLLAIFKITCDQFESLRGWRAFLSGASHGLQVAPTAVEGSNKRRRETVSAAAVEAHV